ncbi:MAG: EAL domain-containing protein, partial [Pseudomonadota bacterium]
SLAFITFISLLLLAFNWLLRKSVAEKTGALTESEQRLETILNSVDAFIFIKDTDLQYRYVNHKVAEFFDCDQADVIGHKDQDFFEHSSAEQLTDNDQQVLDSGQRLARYELSQLRGNDEQIPIWSIKVPLKNSNGEVTGLCGICTDISEYEQLKSEIRDLAYFDVLTGLANRRWLLEEIRNLYNTDKPVGNNALVLIDIDKFKVVNDSLGHELGDELLKNVASRLEHALANGDTAGRLAADEFFILLKQLPVNLEQRQSFLLQRLQDINERLAASYCLDDVEHQVKFSMGASFLSEAKSADSLLKTVDLAVSKAKTDGGNQIQFFSTSLQERFNDRLYLETQLRQAINDKALQIYLQPQYQLDEQLTCIGFEALLRWHHSKLGQVSPEQFIPLAETAGLMPALHSLVLKQAIEALEQLQHHPVYADCRVAINISAGQFKQANFVPELKNALQQSSAAHKLELELTESILVEDVEMNVTIMKELNQLGLQFSLDDFGTGYSSLSYLKRLPLKQLKIDQSFVRDLLSDDNDLAIVRTIIALANSLQLDVLAEGVETEQEQKKLFELGCKRYQGFLLGRPHPLAHWLQE